MRDRALLQRITVRPEVFGGKPIIRDMRISVELILSLLAQGVTPEALLDDYPDLEMEDIRACLTYAHAVIAGDTHGRRRTSGVPMNVRKRLLYEPENCCLRFRGEPAQVWR